MILRAARTFLVLLASLALAAPAAPLAALVVDPAPNRDSCKQCSCEANCCVKPASTPPAPTPVAPPAPSFKSFFPHFLAAPVVIRWLDPPAGAETTRFSFLSLQFPSAPIYERNCSLLI